MKNNNLDKVIKDTYMEFNNEMDMYSNIKVPDFNNTMNKFHNNIKEKKTASSISKRIALVASFTIVVLISTFLSSMPQVHAFKFKIIKTFEELRGSTRDIKISADDRINNDPNNIPKSNDGTDQIEKLVSLEEAKQEVPFKLFIPEDIPNGYMLKDIKVTKAIGNYFSANQTYTNNAGQIIAIYQSTVSKDGEETISMSSELTIKDMIINDIKIKLATDNKNFKNMIWFYDNVKYEMLVPYNVADGEIKEMIKSLK